MGSALSVHAEGDGRVGGRGATCMQGGDVHAHDVIHLLRPRLSTDVARRRGVAGVMGVAG